MAKRWYAWYDLNKDNTVVQCDFPPKDTSHWRLLRTDYPKVRVSTVFLGLDHNFLEEGAPILFETMVFANGAKMIDLACERYSSYSDAVAGHWKFCADAVIGKYDYAADKAVKTHPEAK
jgi:hypothetical protein